MKLFLSIIIVVIFSATITFAQKEIHGFSYEVTSDSCMMGKQVVIWDEDEDNHYDNVRFVLCQFTNVLDFEAVDSSTADLANGMVGHWKQGSLEDSTFFISIYSNAQSMYKIDIWFDKSIQKVRINNHNPLSVETQKSKELYNCKNTGSNLLVFNYELAQISSIKIYDYIGNELYSNSINSSENIITLPINLSNFSIYYAVIESAGKYYSLRIH